MTTQLGSGIDIFLHPGEWYFGDRHTRIHTTLGSCIAVTVWHPSLRLGAMCHYMLPYGGPDAGSLSARYGDAALQLLVDEMRQLGTRARDYEAKLFGGASMYDVGPQGSSIARRNIEAAEALMVKHGMSVVARNLGGTGYRQLVFQVADGDVWVRRGDGQLAAVCPAKSGGLA